MASLRFDHGNEVGTYHKRRVGELDAFRLWVKERSQTKVMAISTRRVERGRVLEHLILTSVGESTTPPGSRGVTTRLYLFHTSTEGWCKLASCRRVRSAS